MNKGKKNLVGLIVAIVLVAGLAGVYVWQNNRQLNAEASATPTPTPAATSFQLITREEEDLDSVKFTANGKTLTIAAQRGAEGEGFIASWVLADAPDIVIDQAAAGDMVRGLYTLSVTEKLFDTVENPADFGINPDMATAVASYADGTTATLHIGKKTPAKDRYYVMLEGDPALYLMYTYYGDRYFKSESELIDRTLPVIDGNSLEYILLAERDKDPIEFGFFGTDEEKQAMFDEYGMIYVTMLNPFPGRELYYSNFEKIIMTEFMTIVLGDMVALNPDDLSEYGLAEPSLEVRFRDKENDMHFLFGDRFGDDQIYCKLAGKPSVYLVDYSYVKPLYNINVFSFIERFIALTDIYGCSDIIIESADGRNYNIKLDKTELPPEDGQTDGTVVITPYIDGQEVQELAFKTFYQRIIGLSYDVEIPLFTPTEPPVHHYTFMSGDEPTAEVRLYTYDNNFYAVQRDDNPIQFVTSRQSVEIVMQSMLDLLAGKLDREY